MTRPIRVLMVEDSEDDALLVLRELRKGGFAPEWERVQTAADMRKALTEKTWDVILCDYKMPRFDGLAALRLMKETGLDLPFIVVSGTIGEETAVASMKAGAHDYIMKGNLLRLVPAVERELKEAESRAQRRQVEAAYQRSEQLLRDAQRIAKVGGWEYDTEAKRTTWTEEVYRIYGVGLDYDPNDISKNIEHYEDQATIEQAFLDAVQRGVSYDIELSFRSADGALKWVRTSGYPVREDGRITKVYGHIVDITEHKRIIEETERARKDWEDIFQAISHPTIILDPEYGILSANKAAVHASGIAAADLAGKKCFEVFHGANNASPPAGCPMQKLLVSGHTETLETEMETPGGVYLVSCTPVFDRQGRLEKSIHIATDITARREMEQAARESEQRYRSIFENAQEAIYRSTPDGKIILANPAMAGIFGYETPEELMASVTDVARQHYVHPEEWEKVMAIIEAHGEARNFESQHRRKDGSLFWASMTMQAIRDQNGRILYYEGIDEDITDRKESIERLRKALGGTVQAISMAVETKDPYTAGHQRRTADLARAIATEMGLDADRRDFIRIAATIHDIGKIALPAEILSKPTKLTEIEFSLIKTHALQGYEILKGIEFPWPVADVVLQHHERIDGTGYPGGLKGKDILLEARILAVADVVEAIASHRPYRPAHGIDDALDEISKNRGILYDAGAVDACLTLFREKMYHLS